MPPGSVGVVSTRSRRRRTGELWDDFGCVQLVSGPNQSTMTEMSLALIGNASAREGRSEEVRAEAFSIRRLEGSRWRLRRTRLIYGD